MRTILFIVICSFFATSGRAEEARLLRFPHINGNQLVFSYAGDLYTTDINGNIARKLTSDIGYEMFPRISPDGKNIAFTGQYDGNTEVFIIPATGGIPKRLTYTATLGRDDLGDRMGPNNIVLGWTPDSKNILFRTRQYTFNDFTGQLMTIPAEGGEAIELPLKNGGFASYSPDGKKLAYNYVFREFRTWKRYQGGMADDIRIFDLNSKQSEKITNNVRQDIIPMWGSTGEKIYFISDRDNVMNLYVYNLTDKSTRQLTTYKDYDIKFPAIGGDQIVYEQGGYIYRFDTQTEKATQINVQINNDQNWARPEWKNVSDQISSMDVAPNGERVVVAARGDIFTLPAKEGITYNLTNSSDANDMNPVWSPDGKWIAYISDKSGEFNIWIRDAINGEERMLTQDLKTYIFDLQWSPDSRSILWNEKRNTLNLTNLSDGKTETIASSRLRAIHLFDWAPDSRYITYVEPGKEMDNIIVYDRTSKEKHLITDGWYNVGSTNFSKDGKYLVFVSARTFNPVYSNTEWNHIYNNMNKVYVLPLAKDAAIPFAPENDQIKVAKEKKETETSKSKGNKEKEETVEYNFADINNRIIELPVTPANYYNVYMIGDNIYFNRDENTYLYNLKDRNEINLGENITFGPAYQKAIASSGRSFEVIDIPTSPVHLNQPISTSNLKKQIDYHQEWEQIYNESWRQMRDFFYAKNMHGVDWNAVYEKYKVLLPYINHRTDLTYIIGEMIGELSVGHSYSANGEHPEPERIPMGLLGARFTKDASGYFKVSKVIEGANWNNATRSPLTMSGVNVKEGDYILAINGNSLKESNNIFTQLIGLDKNIIELEVNNTPTREGSRKVLVTPLSNESQLYYYNWVQNNIRKVSEATNGQVGYIHIPDMGVQGLNEFIKHYYPQLGKKALIIDDRGNGGGNVSPMITERLMRTPTFFTMQTNQTEGSVNPVGTFIGPKVLLVNEYSASDGDLFPYRFKQNKLGTVIGHRTWGGVVGYSGTIPVVDGGSIVTPSYAPFAADGSGFIIEGHGVEPDISIENDPYKEYKGEDQQLNKAIEVILEKLKTTTREIPTIPAFPVK
ncbi:MAG: S41 family peptidase [Odoribacter sp.]